MRVSGAAGEFERTREREREMIDISITLTSLSLSYISRPAPTIEIKRIERPVECCPYDGRNVRLDPIVLYCAAFVCFPSTLGNVETVSLLLAGSQLDKIREGKEEFKSS